jgi:hypothetical protein
MRSPGEGSCFRRDSAKVGLTVVRRLVNSHKRYPTLLQMGLSQWLYKCVRMLQVQPLATISPFHVTKRLSLTFDRAFQFSVARRSRAKETFYGTMVAFLSYGL